MTLNIELLEQSFAAIAPQGDELVDAFYRNLFDDFPQVVPLFEHVEISEQKKKLLASLKLVVANLRHTSTVVSALEDLGARHVDYGAKEEHYPAVGATLLKSLSEVAGDEWTRELQDAWADAYENISKTMIAGAAVPAI
jgi:hemoglobin-like flavoprotein